MLKGKERSSSADGIAFRHQHAREPPEHLEHACKT